MNRLRAAAVVVDVVVGAQRQASRLGVLMLDAVNVAVTRDDVR
jgi:hypothetical protein